MANLVIDLSIKGVDAASKETTRLTGIIEKLQSVSSNLKLQFNKAQSVSELNAIGSSLAVVTGQIQKYRDEAIKGSNAFKDQQTEKILTSLSAKLDSTTANATRFGNTVANQQKELRAYQSAFDSLTKNGLSPFDSRVESIANNISRLNDSIANTRAANLEQQFRQTGALIQDAENKVKNLQRNLNFAQSERDIAKYNVRLQQAEAELTRLINIGKQANGTVNSLGKNVNNASGSLARYTSTNRGANSVAIEFNRIIQDAPFGMIGISNNLTQLIDNYRNYATVQRAAALEQGKTITSTQLLRGAIGAIFSPINLLSLGFAAVTSGIIAYQMWQQRSAKATSESEGSIKSYIETLSGLRRVQADAEVNAQKELTTLEQLYKATQNSALSIDARKKASDELVKRYPDYFKGMSTEQILAGKTADAYEKLATRIQATAIAQASLQKLTDNATKSLNNNLEALDKSNELAQLRRKIQEQESRTTVGRATGSVAESVESANVRELNKLYDQEASIISRIADLNSSNSAINKENALVQAAINNQLNKGATLTGTIGDELGDVNNKFKEAQNAVTEILGTQGNYFQDQVFKINEAYAKLVKDIKTSNASGADINKALGIAEAKRNVDLLVNSFEELFEITKKLNQDAKVTVPANSELTNRAGIILPFLGRNQERFNTTYGSKAISNLGKQDKDFENRLSKVVERGLRNGFNDVFNSIGDLGSNFYEVFSGVFGKLANTVTSTFGQVISTQLGNLLNKKIETGELNIGGLGSNVSKGIVAGGGLLGGILSSQGVKKSNSGLIIAGGALSGAAAGTAIFPGLGTAVGAVVGAIAGIFQSAGAKKQEKLQEAQLAEQRKQVALQERIAALTFTSSIIGQQTSQGIVGDVTRNEFGQLVANIKGSDIQLVLDRNKDKR